MAGAELFFFYLLAVSSPLSIAAINAAAVGLDLFFLARLARGRYAPPAAAWALAGLILWSAVCALFSPLRGEALVGVLNFWSWTALFAGSALPWALRKRLGSFSSYLAFSVVLTMPATLSEFLVGTDIFHHEAFFQRFAPGAFNAYGYFSHHLTYAGVLSVCLFFLAGRALYGGRPFKRLELVGAACAVAGIVLSMARTYYVAAVPALCVLLWGKGKKRILQAAAVLAVLAALGLALGPGRLRQRVENLGDMSNASNAERIYLWVSALHMVEQRPIVGWGMGTYAAVAEPFKAPYASKIHYPGHVGFQTTGHCHNLYLMMAVQCGLPGLALFLLFAALAFRGMARQADPTLRYGAMAAFAAFLVGGLFEFNGGDAEVATIMFFLIGLALAPGGEDGGARVDA